ncbi:MAG TPA: cell filamentation protein Fic, partial [Bacteroidia bacterium]|nr:cell filamentation protein Fic [Bacteroidia bacterium]
MDPKEREIIEFLKNVPQASSKEVFEGLEVSGSYATLKRILAKLKEEGLIITLGARKATKYAISPAYAVLEPVNLEAYYQRDIDERTIKRQFDFQLLREVLPAISILSATETAHLQTLQDTFL